MDFSTIQADQSLFLLESLSKLVKIYQYDEKNLDYLVALENKLEPFIIKNISDFKPE